MSPVISKAQTQKLEKHFSERQVEVLKLIKLLVECESPSGDVAGSRDAVEVLVQAAAGIRCVSSVERIDIPEMGQHLVIRAFGIRRMRARSCLSVTPTPYIRAGRSQ